MTASSSSSSPSSSTCALHEWQVFNQRAFCHCSKPCILYTHACTTARTPFSRATFGSCPQATMLSAAA